MIRIAFDRRHRTSPPPRRGKIPAGFGMGTKIINIAETVLTCGDNRTAIDSEGSGIIDGIIAWDERETNKRATVFPKGGGST